MNELFDYIQRQNVDIKDNRRSQKDSRSRYHLYDQKPDSQNLDDNISSDNDLISYDGEKEEFFNPNESEDVDNNFDSCSRILKAVKDGIITKNLAGVGEKLHREALETLRLECQKVIEEVVEEALQEAKKVRVKAVQDALNEYAEENEEYIRQVKRHHEQKLEEQISQTQKKILEETDKKLEEEKRVSEYRVKLAMEEAQEHFREHLKRAVQEAQEEETRMGDDKFRQMKREFEEKFRELTRVAAEDKQKALARQKRQIQKDQEKEIEEVKRDEEERSKRQFKSQEKEYADVIAKMESKLIGMGQEIQTLSERLKESLFQKSQTDDEITRLSIQLEQFLKLAASADTATTRRHKSRSNVIIV